MKAGKWLTACLLAAGAVLALAGCGTPTAAPTAGFAQATSTPAAVPTTSDAPGAGAVKPHKSLPGVAAVVNGETVPMWEFRALLTLNAQTAGITATAPASPVSPVSPALAAIRARTARQVVDESLLNAYARAHGLAAPPATVEARFAVYRLQGGAGFAASLARLHVSSEQFRRMIKRNLNAQAVTQRIINAIDAPPVQVQVVQIVVSSQQQAQQIHDEVAHGADAMLIAAQRSSDPLIRRVAGQLPPLTRTRGDAAFGPHWSRIAFTPPPGATSDPVLLKDGWAVIQVVEREPATAVMEGTLSHFIATLRRGARITTYAG